MLGSTHPVLLLLLFGILAGIVQHIFTPKRNALAGVRMQHCTIGVVLVAPPGEAVEPKLATLLHGAARPECVRFYVAKLAQEAEAQEVIQDLRVRVATRLHYVHATHGDAARLRARLIPEVLERYLLVLSWDHATEMGWDDSLINALEQPGRGREAAVLTSRLAPRDDHAGFPTVAEHSESATRFEWRPFIEPPKYAQPAIAASVDLLFGPSEALGDRWPSVDTLRGADEDATVSAVLWMRGVDFFAPAELCFWRERLQVSAEAFPGGKMRTAEGRTTRTRAEFLTALGVRKGRVGSRGRSGLTHNAAALERFAKIGQTFTVYRDL